MTDVEPKQCPFRPFGYFIHSLLVEWLKIPIENLQIIVESLPRKVKAVKTAEVGPTPF